MRRARVRVHGAVAAVLEESSVGGPCRLAYVPGYAGPAVSLALPVRAEPYDFPALPPFFDGLLPDGGPLACLLRARALPAHDRFAHLLAVGDDLVGATSVEALPDEDEA